MNDLGLDLELRLVRYFTVVAEHLSFSQAAAELHLAQPSLSRQIQRLEQRLGVRLIDRTPHGNHLTEAGRAFLPEARALLRTARRAALTAQAHSPHGRLTVGYVDDLFVTPAVRELRERRPQATIDTRHLNCLTLEAFSDGQVDVLVARAPLPFPAGEVHTRVLYEETRLLAVPAGHPLAERISVSLDELAGERPFPCSAFTGSEWSAYRLLGYDPDRPGRPVESYEDKLELVASGQAVGILPSGDRRIRLHPGVVTVPLDGAPVSQVLVAVRAGDPNPLARDFLSAATTHLTGAARALR